MGKDYCQYPPLFMGADSCAGGSATGVAELIHGDVTPVNWVIEGMKSDALVPVQGSGVAVYLVQDKFSNQELILHSGGMLKCDPTLVSTTVTSSSQVGHFYNTNKGRQGAQFHTANPEAGYMQLPNGHAVDFHVNDDGAFGYMATPIHPNDPRMKSCAHIWISEDCVYRPPGRYTMLPMRINDQLYSLHYGDDATVQRFHILRQKITEPSAYTAASNTQCLSPEFVTPKPTSMPDKLVENDVEDLASSAVETVLEQPAMGKYVYIEPLTDSSEDMAILQHIWGGSGAGPILDTMTHGHGGKQMLSQAGFNALESFNTRFSFPAAGMSSHKLYRNAKMDRDRERFRPPVGFSLVTDTLHLGFRAPMFGYFQLFCDSRVKCGNVYAMWNKTGDAYLSTLKEHVSLFAKPPRLQEIASDADPALIMGPAKEWMQSKCLKTKSGVPHVPGTSLIERKYVRHFSNVVSHLMLDSQLPLRFLETVGQMACLIISYLHIEFEGRHTTSFFEMFKTEPDLRTLKRVGCEAFWLLLKKDRAKYGSKGVRGVFVGIAAHTHPEWTYIVWSPLTNKLYFRRDVLFNQSSMPFRDARTLITTSTSGPMSLRRGIATYTRSEFRDAIEDYNLDHFDVHGNPESPFSDLGAPAFLPVHDHIGSPIQSGDTLFIGDSPTVVTSVSPQVIRSQDLITNTVHETSPAAKFFKDSSNMLTRSRYTTRFRAQPAFFTYNRLGGENDTQEDPSDSKDDVRKQDGSDLIGSQFWDSPSEDEMPKSFTVIGTKKHVTGGIQYKMLEYQLTEELGVAGAEVESSRVFEVRNWMDRLPPETNSIESPTAAATVVIEDPTSLPTPLTAINDDDVALTTSSLFTTDGIGDLAIADGPLEKDEVAAVLRLKIRTFKIARRPGKIPQRVVKKILMCHAKGKQIKKAFFKFGTEMPSSYQDAKKGKEWPAWKREMDEEITTLSDLGAFIKGLSMQDLPEGYDASTVIRSIWVYDVKVDGRKRARFAARGDMEAEDPDDDRYSPVAQMKSIRVLLAVAAQLNLEIVTMDFPKAFLLGKMDKSRPIFMFAPDGYGERGEIWSIQLPLYGLTVSSRRFYESLSEFMRAVGFTHFAGGDPCLFRRRRQLPSPEQALINHKAATELQLPGRPLEDGIVFGPALPRAPQASRIGPSRQEEFEYPSYMDTTHYKEEPNVLFEPYHAEGLDPHTMNGLFPGEYYELAAVYDMLMICLDSHMLQRHWPPFSSCDSRPKFPRQALCI